MKKCYGRWTVSARGYWFQDGKWKAEPDRSRPFSSHAYPQTKVGAYRIARKAPTGAFVEIVLRFSGKKKKFPEGYERFWEWVQE